ncbi:MAG TPA: hypothetical protein PLE61_06900 [Vicinamibacterales bacterium]|nr:hypothetical protein [Vicinamibacterales bacterium]HOG28804.1 hypothetical protein [Vicinamibacterales bacterium]HOQ59226.1 hypothetical protein [Vicinamibacterales bacterium]HPW20527.1 hypothetical protein [Vicinamibacterales bacterium]
MATMLTLAAMAVFGLFVLGLVGGLLKLLFWLLVLPFRLLGLVLKLLFGLLLLPLFLALAVVGAAGFGLLALLGLLLPFLPLLVLGLAVWGLAKLIARPAVASGA